MSINEIIDIAKKYASNVAYDAYSGTVWMNEGSDSDGMWYGDPGCIEMAKNELEYKFGRFIRFSIRRDPVPGESYDAVTGIQIDWNDGDVDGVYYPENIILN